MDRSDVITLIKYARAQDANGVWRDGETTRRDVFCQKQSVSRNEFFLGGQNGLKPEYKVTMFSPDYNGAKEVEFEGKRYGIYRTYLRQDELLELYLERKTGV